MHLSSGYTYKPIYTLRTLMITSGLKSSSHLQRSDFGHLSIPQNFLKLPPSLLQMLTPVPHLHSTDTNPKVYFSVCISKT